MTDFANALPYDLVVIGSGPAGEKAAAQAAYFGKRVALCEKEPHFGGAAANTGTLPSKTLRETALYLSGYRQRGLYGIDANLRERAGVQDFLRREKTVREAERKRIVANLSRHNVDVHQGLASFADGHHIQVNGAKPALLRGDKIVIATGSRPFRPPQFPFDLQNVYDSDEILGLDCIPDSMIVCGGGVIGCEYACVFATLGTRVTIVERAPELLSFLDSDISDALKSRMEALGIVFRMPETVANVEITEGEHVRLALSGGDILEADTCLVASGRTGNTDKLNLQAAGIEANARGQLAVDTYFRTSVPHIYAVGDVIGFPALASAGMEQGRIAVCHAFDLGYKKSMAPILPYGIYTIPEVSVAGLSEEEAQEKNVPHVVGVARFADNARGGIIGDDHGFLKLVFSTPDMRLLGAHLIGEQASELIHIGLTAILAKEGADLFIQTCYNYPTLAETYKYATYDALGKLPGARPETQTVP